MRKNVLYYLLQFIAIIVYNLLYCLFKQDLQMTLQVRPTCLWTEWLPFGNQNSCGPFCFWYLCKTYIHVYACFIHFQKAFDKVKRELIEYRWIKSSVIGKCYADSLLSSHCLCSGKWLKNIYRMVSPHSLVRNVTRQNKSCFVSDVPHVWWHCKLVKVAD